MTQIAIIKVHTVTTDYDYDESTTIVDSISDWCDVSEDDLKVLRRTLHMVAPDYRIVEQVPPNKVPLLVSACIEAVLLEEQRVEKEKKKKAEAKRQRELKKRAATEAEEKRLLLDLQRKYAPEKEHE
jgi:hypothetical protein